MNQLVLPVGFLLTVVSIAIGVSVFSINPAEQRAGSGLSDTIEPFLIDEAVRPISPTTADGKPVSIDEKTTDKTVVTFWNSQCGECRAALITVSEFMESNPEITPIYINVRDTVGDATAALKDYELDLETLYDDGTAFQTWLATIPASYFIEDGRFRAFFPGRVSPKHLEALLSL
jgi:thiol-disulfide isomerase/thioredoxin